MGNTSGHSSESGVAKQHPERDMAGRVVVITGASRGLGAGMAARLAERGARLGLCARHEPVPPPGIAAADVVTAAVDVTDPAGLDRFCTAVAERLGPIELWVNNAGVLEPIAPVRDADPETVANHVDINVTGVIHGSATYARHVRSRAGGGALVNITSGAASTPYPGWGAYCASKAAVDQLTRVVGVEEVDAGLRALAVAPGVVDTDMQAAIRATPVDRFPPVQRFLDLHAADAFNSPAWVADHIVTVAFGPFPAGSDVVVRVPNEPKSG